MPSLIWKEWHEQSWKLGFGCVVLGALALIGLRARVVADEAMVNWVCGLGFMLLPVLSSTGLVPAERSEGSFESLLALPVAPWRILATKTLIGLVLCVGPMLAAAVVTLLVAGGREMTNGVILNFYFHSALAGAALFMWLLALTIRLPSETRAGLVALGALICFLIAATVDQPMAISILSPLTFELSIAGRRASTPPLFVLVELQGLIVAVLWVWALGQMTRAVEGGQ